MAAAEASILTDAVIYLGAAVVCVPIAARFGLGSVLGYLLAGCAIGPWGLVFISDVESILHFSEFGVVLMLFLIGLELDPKRLLQMRGPVFGGGGLQMLSCGAALSSALYWLGLPWPGAIAAGMALALSSTAIAVQTMSERNLLAAPVGRGGFSVLLFQDIAAIPLIALVPLLGVVEDSGEPVWLGVAKVFGAIAAVIMIGVIITPRLMRLIAVSRVREIFTAFALLLVIGIAQLMSLADLSMALGAFLAGVLLASSEYRHALETDIAPFKGLLLGLFFIAVGMSIDFGLVVAQPQLLAILVVGLVTIKALLLALIAPLIGVARQKRWLFAALLAQAGEFAFVIFGVAREARVLPGSWEALLTASVALSMAVTPLMVLAHEKLAARRASKQSRGYDKIEDDGASVLIIGFGRYGQIVGRLLFAQGITATVLDHDPDQIDMLRRFGFKVFYGDATRIDMLEAAGAAKAKLAVVTVDSLDVSLAIVDVLQKEFPHLKIVACARNVRHWFELVERGLGSVERETFESALRTGRQALEALGIEPYEAREVADLFRRHNLAALQALRPHFHDEAKTVALDKSGQVELEQNLRRDREMREARRKADGWH
jgi:glutathione-regulated potassium-efflux system ancillary protein KefC